MTFKLKILSVALLSAFLLFGCGKDDKVKPPTEPATASGVTDANGHVSIDVGNFTVNADVRDTVQAALPSITVDVYLLHNNIAVIARDSANGYLPTVAVSSWSGSGKQSVPDRGQSPVYIAGAEVQAAIVMQPIQQGVYSYQQDPPNMDVIVGDEWTTETSHFGSMNDLRVFMDTVSAYNQGVYIRLAPAVVQVVGAGSRTAAFSAQSTVDLATFAAIFGMAFPIFQDDSLYFSQMEYGDFCMPLINVDNIRMHRNFWAQFTLIWGQNPSDLDSHLWTPLFGASPSDSAVAHICYYRRGANDAPPYADLDVDDVTSFGPEHVTIYENFPGTYVYAVHHYSGSGTFYSSGAKVNLLKPDGTVQAFDAPPDVAEVGDDWYWHVCSVDGETGAVTPINTYSPDPPRGDYLSSVPDQSLLKAAD